MVQTRAAGLRGSLGAMWQPAPSPDFYCQHLPASSGGTCTTKMKQCFICNCAKLQQDFVPWGAAPAFLQLGDAAQWQKCGCVPSTFNSGCAALCFVQSSENLGSVGLCYGSCHISLFAGNINQAASHQLLNYGAKWSPWKYFRLCASPNVRKVKKKIKSPCKMNYASAVIIL